MMEWDDIFIATLKTHSSVIGKKHENLIKEPVCHSAASLLANVTPCVRMCMNKMTQYTLHSVNH